MPVHAAGHPPAGGCQGDDECAPVPLTDAADDERALAQPIEDAGEGRALVGEHAVQVAD